MHSFIERSYAPKTVLLCWVALLSLTLFRCPPHWNTLVGPYKATHTSTLCFILSTIRFAVWFVMCCIPISNDVVQILHLFAEGFKGWDISNGGDGWSIRTFPPEDLAGICSAFVSSYLYVNVVFTSSRNRQKRIALTINLFLQAITVEFEKVSRRTIKCYKKLEFNGKCFDRQQQCKLTSGTAVNDHCFLPLLVCQFWAHALLAVLVLLLPRLSLWCHSVTT